MDKGTIAFQGRNLVIREQTGRGATSVVYIVEDTNDKRRFACKVSDRIDIVRAEAALLKELNHPLFPRWVDYCEEQGKAILLMEYISGSSLHTLLQRRGRLSIQETVRIATELADGIAYLQERPGAYIYRDLKPENVVIGQDGSAHLLDLGAAAAGEKYRVGTMGYAPPELFLDDRVWPGSDVYTLGKMMQYMITGQDPCSNSSISEGKTDAQQFMMEKVSFLEGRGLYRFRGLADIVERCICLRPEERIQDMRELILEMSVYRSGSRIRMIRREIALVLYHIRRKLPFIQVRERAPVYEKNIWLSCYKDLGW